MIKIMVFISAHKLSVYQLIGILGGLNSPSDNIGALIAPHQFISLEIALITRQSVTAIGEGQEATSDDFALLEFALVLHLIAASKHAK